jgi:type IX secretion system PorP/SprF family membrane protein
MKKVFRYPLLAFLGLVLSWQSASAQDVNYSQYFSAPLYFNPAFTGINTGVRARFLFRDQWPNLPQDFKAYYFSADLGDRNLPGAGGLGLMVNQDNEGIGFIHNLNVALDVAVRIPLTPNMIAQVGIKAAVVQKSVNWDDFVFSDQLSAKYGNIYNSSFIPPESNTKVFPDFAAGGILQFMTPQGNMNGNMGFAVDHIFKPDESFLSNASAPLPRKFIAHGDLVFSTGYVSSSSFYRASDEPLKIDIGALYQNQDKLNSLEVGLNLLKYNIYLGSWYKNTLTGTINSAIALLAGYRFMFAQDVSLRFMYSYDLQISGAQSGTGGAHEVSLVLEFDKVQLFGRGGGGGGGFVPGGGRKGSSAMECPTFY